MTQAELLKTFNCGIGMIAVVAPDRAEALAALLRGMGETVTVLGRSCRGGRDLFGRLAVKPRRHPDFRGRLEHAGAGARHGPAIIPARPVLVAVERSRAGGLARAAALGVKWRRWITAPFGRPRGVRGGAAGADAAAARHPVPCRVHAGADARFVAAFAGGC
jgi:hypothetical protein